MKAKAQKKSSVQRSSPDQKRVLVITETPNAPFVSSLDSAGLKVVGISTPAAAPIALRRSRPHVVIASIGIRGLSTSELTRLLQRDNDSLPLILVGSDVTSSKRRHEAMQAGAFDYFQLPAELELLTLRVSQLVSLRQVIDKLRGEADLDTLTGLANRRRFRVALARELERWRRYGVPCSLLLLDIDYMKKINDTHGHPAGDLVLREVASTLAKASRDTDTAARLGGEEFALLCANVGGTEAEFAGKRLRAILAEQRIEGIGNITVSIGVAACPEHANSERTLYAASDAALYVAKNEGRNRVAVARRLQEELPELKHRK